VLSDTNARLAAARRLTSRSARREAGLFLAEGTPAVTAALGRPGTVVEVFGTPAALDRNAVALETARAADIRIDAVSERSAAALSETVTPQGLVAVCRMLDRPWADVRAGGPRLVAALVAPRDPGNVGAIVRTADAAGADAVVLAGDSVDVYNGKTVRASAGSLFHLDIVLGVTPAALLDPVADLVTLATSGNGDTDLDVLIADGSLGHPTMWLFGTEAHGLPAEVADAARARVRIPIYGRAESLNLAAEAAVCLYASARAQRAEPTR
jgi:TrmH family RNA methyltransferase